jgi:hypothetical protein
MKTPRAWLLAAMMVIVALLAACSQASPNGDPLYRPLDELNEKPKKKDGGASSEGGTTTPQSPPGDDSGTPVPSNTLVLSSISPVSATAGSSATALTVSGAGFGAQTRVLFGAQTFVPTQQNSTTLTVQIPATALANAGNVDVRVVDGSTTAGPVTFTVSNAQMTLTSITPNSASAGAGDVSIVLRGTGFVQSARATFNGAQLTTTYTSATELSAIIPATSLQAAGTFSVSVTAGASTASPQTFTVRSAKPVFQAFSPSSAPAGTFGGYITIVGSGFDASTRGTVNGYLTNTVVDSPTRMRLYLSTIDLAFPGFLRLRIANVNNGTGIFADGVGYFEVY